MGKDASFDIVSEFDMQELRNAVDQTDREITNRYDFKGVHCELELNEDSISLVTVDMMKIEAVKSMLLQKIVNRGLSPKILKAKDPEDVGGGNKKVIFELIKSLDQDTAKKISKYIREDFPKCKPSIQGDSVRVTGKSRDDLQAIITMLKKKEDIEAPLVFTNYR